MKLPFRYSFNGFSQFFDVADLPPSCVAIACDANGDIRPHVSRPTRNYETNKWVSAGKWDWGNDGNLVDNGKEFPPIAHMEDPGPWFNSLRLIDTEYAKEKKYIWDRIDHISIAHIKNRYCDDFKIVYGCTGHLFLILPPRWIADGAFWTQPKEIDLGWVDLSVHVPYNGVHVHVRYSDANNWKEVFINRACRLIDFDQPFMK